METQLMGHLINGAPIIVSWAHRNVLRVTAKSRRVLAMVAHSFGGSWHFHGGASASFALSVDLVDIAFVEG